ncbi:MAG: LLM class flavin-dependent oxidoreductase, partial [bacterium]|nr:LLM class flavin-dependent oxidoreductase [bacterium]
ENPEPITDVTTNATAAYTLVHCADTPQQVLDNEVWKSVEWWYSNLAQFILDWELPELSQEERDATFPLLKPLMEEGIDDLIHHFDEADMIVVGDVDTCYEKMKHYADIGVDQLICYVQFGYHSHESIMRTIELLGKEIIPELENYTPSPKES